MNGKVSWPIVKAASAILIIVLVISLAYYHVADARGYVDPSLGSMTAGDPTLHPLSSGQLESQIANVSLSSSRNSLLLARAATSHLQGDAYYSYRVRYENAPSSGFYQNLWKGEAAVMWADTKDGDEQFQYPLYQVGEQCLEKAVKMRPDSALANAYLGSLLFEDNSPTNQVTSPQAVAMIRHAIYLDPKCADAYIALGKVYCDFQSGSWINPIKGQYAYEKAMTLDPTSSSVRLALLKAAIFNSDKKAARRATDGAVALVHGDAARTKEISSWIEQISSIPAHPFPTAYFANAPDPVFPTRQQEENAVETAAAKSMRGL